MSRDVLKHDSTMVQSYYSTLKNRIFKILPLYEEGNIGVSKYIHSLLFELGGVESLVEGLKHNHEFISLVATLESLYDESLIDNDNCPLVKREVFKCINIIERIQKGESNR
jgi:hypothetical protein